MNLSVNLLKHLVTGIKTIIEVGAHNGSDSLKMLFAFPESKIYCFECDPRLLKRFPRHPRLSLFPFAVANFKGNAHFQPSGIGWDNDLRLMMSGSLLTPTGHLTEFPKIKFGPPIQVQVVKLDDFDFGEVIDLLWIDAQGAEGMILEGGVGTLLKTRYLKIECHQKILYQGQISEIEMIRRLGKCWKLIDRYGEDLFFERIS